MVHVVVDVSDIEILQTTQTRAVEQYDYGHYFGLEHGGVTVISSSKKSFIVDLLLTNCLRQLGNGKL